MMKKILICSSLSLILAGVVACSPPGGSSNTVGSSDDNGNTPSDITNYVFTKTDPSCSAYVGEFTSKIKDLGNNRTLTGSLSITTDGNTCTISSNSIPNHNVNDTGAFATTVSEVNTTFRVPVSPTVANSPTQLSLEYDNAVFLNGAKLDLLAAACYGIGPEPLGQEKIGCFQTNTPWRYDPMSPLNQFGTDSHNAHTQPNGAYHYHGDPVAMYVSGGKASGVIGFAADGFPIYGPFIDDNGDFRRVTSSYALRSGARQSQSGEGAFPGGNYDGTYVDDYEYQEGSGDLDECNGRVTNGRYGYYVTSSYPWIMKCFKGTPDSSFQK
ncbi:MAG: YHYH protein [bacterium]